MDPWANLEWHYDVHDRFAEELVYYLLRVRPFRVNDIKTRLKSLLERENLESVRIFEIFGRNDLLVRAWLHPVVNRDFPDWLKDALSFETEIEVFTVRDPFVILSKPPTLNLSDNSDLLNNLYNEEIIQAVQEGRDESLLERLIHAGIVLSRDQTGPDPIKFFLSIRLSQESQKIKDAVSKDLFEHVSKNIPTMSNVSIYQGTGFCHLLLKGEVVHNFFAIGELIEWILNDLSAFEASTETYVVALPGPLVETPDRISTATFQAIRGKDLFVYNVLPELYEKYFSHKDEIERVFTELSKPTVIEAKKLVHDYLLAYLKQKNAEMKIVLFTFFNELEEFLRDHHTTLAVSNHLDLIDLYKKIEYKDNAKHIALGKLFDFYYQVAVTLGVNPGSKWAADLKELAQLRNKPLHGDWDFRNEWKASLQLVLKSWPWIKIIVDLIKSSEEVEYEFTYLPFLNRNNGRAER